MKISKKVLLPLIIGIVVIAAIVVGIIIGTSGSGSTPKKDSYTVTYVYNNGEEDKKTTVKKGELAIEPNDPVKEGYTFDGWWLEDELYDFSTPVVSNITLEANWEKSGPSSTETARISWRLHSTDDAAYKYLFDGTKPDKVNIGTEIKFRLWTSPYYTGTPTVEAGSKTLTADGDGYYSFTVTANTSVSVSGLKHDTVKLKGWGTPQNPYVIERPSQLEKIAKDVNSDKNTKFNTANFILKADLDLKGATIDPIGAGLENSTAFRGTFDGNNHTISNFKINEEYGVIGLFGNGIRAEITSLHIVNDYKLDMRQEASYIIGGIVGYSIACDIYDCSFNGSITTNSSIDDLSVFVGGIAGFAQGYTEQVPNIIAYCSVNANFSAQGSKEIMAAGGILGGGVGTMESAPSIVTNCTYNGDITGKHNLVGGVVGYFREFSSISNCFTSGSYVGMSNSTLASAGGIVGLADNETVISYSYSTATTQADGSEDGMENFQKGDSVVGLKYKKGTEITGLILSVDGRCAYEYNSYQTANGKVEKDGTTYDLTTMKGLKDLLGWKETEWAVKDGKPVVSVSDDNKVDYTVKIHFNGETVDFENEEGVTQEVNGYNCKLNSYMPLNWLLGGTGQNTLTALSGKISYGFFFDENCTERIPSSMLLTKNMDVYVGFADYSGVEGEYEVVISVPRTLTESEYHYAKLIFDNQGRVIIELEGMRAAYVYVYNGEYIVIRGAYFANLLYNTNGTQYETDFYLVAQDGETFNQSNELILHDNVFFSDSNRAEYAKPIKVYRPTPALGVWYDANGGTATFKSDFTGTYVSSTGKEDSFTYEYSDGNVILTYGAQTLYFTIDESGSQMEQSDMVLFDRINRYDDFKGTWETTFEKNLKVHFDGKSKVSYKGQTYDYTVTDGVLAFADVTVKFDEYGLMELTENGETLIFGKEGSFIGIWSETMYNYEVRFEGIGKYGYGYAVDTQGVPFTYTSTLETKDGKTRYRLDFYYRTMVYGYAYSTDATYAGSTEITSPGLALAVFNSKQGLIVDDYCMTYQDAYLGTWNSTERSLEFNGFGLYNIEEGNWKAKGEVIVTEGETETVGTYYYDYVNAKAIVTIGDKEYEATLVENGVRLVGNGEDKTYIPFDVFGDTKYQGKDVELSFNGRGNVNAGKAELSLNGGTVEKYDYTLEGKVATLLVDGVEKYTATINEETKFIDLKNLATATTQQLGLLNKMSEKTYVTGESDEYVLYIDGYFDLDGNAKGSINGIDVDFKYTNENQAGLYYNDELIYVLLYNQENNIILYDGNLNPLTVLTTADEWRGTYENANGDTLIIDGRGILVNFGGYGTLHFNVDGEEFYYVYVIYTNSETGEVMLNVFELDRSEDVDNPIKRYTISKEETAGSVAYAMGEVVIYVTAVAE